MILRATPSKHWFKQQMAADHTCLWNGGTEVLKWKTMENEKGAIGAHCVRLPLNRKLQITQVRRGQARSVK